VEGQVVAALRVLLLVLAQQVKVLMAVLAVPISRPLAVAVAVALALRELLA
jgi:hypothetical protein